MNPPDDATRFQVELEFVQCLSNPAYLHWLAQQDYFEDAQFIQYLTYLYNYWSLPSYRRYLQYPTTLFFLSALQDASFRTSLKSDTVIHHIHEQQFSHWHQPTNTD